MLVMNEFFDFWTQGKNANDYHLYFSDWWQRDVTSTVLRDRNHPSVMMWSIGNEIPGVTTPQGAEQSRALAQLVRSVDPGSGRAVTSASVHYTGNSSDAEMAPLDVAGYNYVIDPTKPATVGSNKMMSDHVRVPSRVMMQTESDVKISAEIWAFINNASSTYVLGDFLWTAWDYIGESGIGHETETGDIDEQNTKQGGAEPAPWHLGFCGDIDIVGHQKPQAFYRRVLFNVSDLEMAVHRPIPAGKHEVVGPWGWPEELQSWTWPESVGQNMSLRVFSHKARFVTALLNGKVVVQATASASTIIANLEVPYAAGNLTVHSFTTASARLQHAQEGGQGAAPFATRTFLTAGAPAALRLTADRSAIKHSRDDLSYVTVTVVDSSGVPVPEARANVTFAIDGPGEIAAVGSGDPRDTASFYQGSRMTWNGKAIAIVRPTGAAPGKITLSAAASGLPTATAVVVTAA
jgi:beta-galactosidase